jgi:hypothetical protein
VTDVLFPAGNPVLQSVHHAVQVIVTFGLFVCASILFRVNHIGDVRILVSHMFTNLDVRPSAFIMQQFEAYEMVLALLVLVTLGTVEWLQERWPIFERFSGRPLWAQCALSYALMYSILMFGEFSLKPFIYFQF